VLAGSRDDAELARMLGAAGPYLARLVPELGPAPSRAELESLARRARITLGRPSDGPADAKNSPSEVGAEFHLTKRERQVLAPLADGRTNRQIANTLYISDKTTSVHVSNILSKLGVTNRGQAAAVAHRLGMTR
jgi:DNA-binding NarL/FixJ family response regulator